MIQLPLGPVMALFQSAVTLFDVTLSRDGAGRPGVPHVAPDRDPLYGIIQPADADALRFAERAGLLIRDGAYVLHTTAAVHAVEQVRERVYIEATTVRLAGRAPLGTGDVAIRDANGDLLADVETDPDSPTFDIAISPSLPVGAAVFTSYVRFGDVEASGPVLRAVVGSSATLAGYQTYCRHNGALWKAWSIANWQPHQRIARYILTKYFDTDGVII